MHEELQRQIRKIAEECAAPGWDGYGASPVTPEAVSQARRFAEAIPTELPMPTIGVEPDGALTFEWYRDRTQMLSVSVDASAALPYAAALPSGTISGTEIFHGQVPQKLVAVIRYVRETGGQSLVASGNNIC